jgi:hypothetical protein
VSVVAAEALHDMLLFDRLDASGDQLEPERGSEVDDPL